MPTELHLPLAHDLAAGQRCDYWPSAGHVGLGHALYPEHPHFL